VKVCDIEQRDWEAQAHMAILFLAQIGKYFAALGPDSLSHIEPPHPTSKEKSKHYKYLSLTTYFKRSQWIGGKALARLWVSLYHFNPVNLTFEEKYMHGLLS